MYVYSLETLQLFQKGRKVILNIENGCLLSVLLRYRTFFAVFIILKCREILQLQSFDVICSA